jgi:hypothetical protein
VNKIVEEIANKSYELGASDCQCENCTIDRTIRITIEALAQEADLSPDEFHYQEVVMVGDSESEDRNMGPDISDWLRAHLEENDG